MEKAIHAANSSNPDELLKGSMFEKESSAFIPILKLIMTLLKPLAHEKKCLIEKIQRSFKEIKKLSYLFLPIG